MKRRYKTYNYEPSAQVPRSTRLRLRRKQMEEDRASTALSELSSPHVGQGPTSDCNHHQDPIEYTESSSSTSQHELQIENRVAHNNTAEGNVHGGPSDALCTNLDFNSCSDTQDMHSINTSAIDQSHGSSGDEHVLKDTPQSTATPPKAERPIFERPLCPCTDATAGDIIVMTLGLALRHNLPWVAQVDILKMLGTLFKYSDIPDSKHLYWNFVRMETLPTNIHYFCPNCQIPVHPNTFENDGITACQCETKISIKTAPQFITLDLGAQIKSMLKEPSFVNPVRTYRFNRPKFDANALEDIYDGLEYRKFFENNGILSNPDNFSYSFNTDGVKAGVSCSVNRTMWPIFLTINELPPEQRRDHVLLAGLYVGHKHPNMNTFLQPFVEQANNLSENGINWTDETGREINSKLIPLCAVVDSPARCSMLQANSFSSKYGCTFCYFRTQRRKFSGRKVAKLRTHESTIHDMLKAHEKRHKTKEEERRYKGLWRPSVLMNLKYFDLVKGFVPDYMHAVLLGVVQQHTEILLDPQRKKKFWFNMDNTMSIDVLITLIDLKLLNFTPPHSITRLPRGLKDRNLWKASEWRSWLLFYAVLCFHGKLKDKYFIHFCMLSVAINILLQKSITQADLQYAEEVLVKYVFLYEQYFGETAMNYCVHLLLHITEGVRNFSGLWTHNAFIYEGHNRYLLQLLSSPTKVALQLTTKYMTYLSLPVLCQKLASCETSVQFCEYLTGRQLKFFHRSSSMLVIGNGSEYKPTYEEEICFRRCALSIVNCKEYQKCIINRLRFSTHLFSRGNKNNDSIAVTVGAKMYLIIRIIMLEDKSGVLLTKKLIEGECPFISSDLVQITHVSLQYEDNELVLLRPEEIVSQGVVMKVKNDLFVSSLPYGCLGD